MPVDNPLGAAKEGVALIGELIRAGGDNPNVKAAGNELGKTALAITKTINNALLPLAAINFAFDKARSYFSERFQADLAEKAASIPVENLVEPKASIAGPALQGLAFSHEEQDLKNMYLNLLASAMDGRVAEDAHPAFVEIIRQLSAEDAQLVRGALRSPNSIGIVELRLQTSGTKGFRTLARHLLNLRNSESGQPVENPRLPALVDNWIRLGLVDVTYERSLTGADSYAWVEKRPELLRLRAAHESESDKVTFHGGVLTRTSFGQQFAKAVGIQ